MTQPSEPQAQPPADLKLHCLKCGYNLTGLTREVCPECGAAFRWEELMAASKTRWGNGGLWGIGLFLLAPAFCVFADALALVVKHLFFNKDLAELIMMGSLGVGLLIAFVCSFIRGRWVARRLARKSPGDPPTPATVGMTLLYGSLAFVLQFLIVLFMVVGFCGSYIAPPNFH
ncbi:MAG: hypothetical protein NTW19_15035 [Planctomycetota bacterium]|nr:hypothetical protein [Planctomycetota bacterium]